MPIALAERGGSIMKSRFPALVALAVTAVVAAPSAQAVTVRVEGESATLVDSVVTTTATPVSKDGGAHTCAGTSAAGALEQATGGDWTGPWFDGFGFSAATIRGESHPFLSGAYWSLLLDGVPASVGLCDLVPQAGDEVLLAAVPETDLSPSPLVLQGVPATATAGCPVPVRVARVLPSGALEPVAGATVAGAVTGAAGTASVTFTASGAVKATKPGLVRSAAKPVTVTPGACGPAPPLPPVDGARPAARDRTAPRARITSIREGARFRRGRGPRTLAGRVSADPSGIAAVRVRLKRNRGGVCAGWDARRERLVPIKRCGTHRFGRWFSVGTAPRWSYLLPGRLGRGRYVLDVQARDRAGNATLIDRGRTRVIFRVA
jgi:hypothetical protein